MTAETGTARDGSFAEIAAQATIDLHVVLENWFNAREPTTLDDVLAHFHDDFRIVSPAGRTTPLTQFAAILPNLRGSRPGLEMRIKSIECRQSGPDWALVSYVEKQSQNGETTSRISSVLLRAADTAPHARWVHLQETWDAA